MHGLEFLCTYTCKSWVQKDFDEGDMGGGGCRLSVKYSLSWQKNPWLHPWSYHNSLENGLILHVA